MTYEIVCTRGPMKGRRWELTQKGVKIGRAESCEVCVEDVSAELFHCIVKLVGGKPVVLNLASDKGVVVNGSYTGEAQLKPMDVICVGNEWFLVSAPGGGKGGSGARMAAAAVALLLALSAVAFVLWRKGQSKPSAAPHPPAAATNDVAQVESPVTTNRVVRIVGEEIVVTNRIVHIVDNVVVTNYVVETRRSSEKPQAANGLEAPWVPGPTDGLVLSADGKTLLSAPKGLKSVAIPDGVTKIADRALAGQKELMFVSIPPSVAEIGQDVFSGCDRLAGIFISDIAAWCSLSFTRDEMWWLWGDYPLQRARNLFLGGTLVEELEIPQGVTSIGENAFRGCASVTRVTIPDSVVKIETGAFADCQNLSEIVVAENNKHYKSVDGLLLTRDGRTLVAVPAGKEQVAIPKGVVFIGDKAFLKCKRITKLDIPNGVTEIGFRAFSDCVSLGSISFPPSLAKIAHRAFGVCKNLADVYITDLSAWCRLSVSEHCGLFYDGGGRLHLDGVPVTEMKIPEGVTQIGGYVFRGCVGLMRVTIPRSVERIGENPFCSCPNLTWIEVANGNRHYKSDDGLLLTRDGKVLKAVPGGLGQVKIPNGIETVGGNAVAGCNKIVEVKIPQGVTYVDYKAFSGCRNLAKVELPKSLKHLGRAWGAFDGCKKLESITIPGSVESIAAGAFAGCTRLKDVTIQDGVKSIGGGAFEFTAITNITIPDSVEKIGPGAFKWCRSLESVTVPAALTTIHERAFIGCPKLLDANGKPRLTRVLSDGKK